MSEKRFSTWLINLKTLTEQLGLPSGTVVKNVLANAGVTGGGGSVLGLLRTPGVGNGNPLQYSCLKKSMDRGAWQAIVHGVAKSCTSLSTHTHTHWSR